MKWIVSVTRIQRNPRSAKQSGEDAQRSERKLEQTAERF